MTVDELLRQPRIDLQVREGTEVVLDPDGGEHARFHHRVDVRRFDELRTLRLVPASLDEGAARAAIAADDSETLLVVRERPDSTGTPCGCHETTSAPRSLHASYDRLRPRHNPRLAAVMSRSTTMHAWYDPAPAMVRSWVTRLTAASSLPIAVWLWKDIEIQKNATLKLKATTKHFHCNDLRIHVGGKLVVGSGTSVICQSAAGHLP